MNKLMTFIKLMLSNPSIRGHITNVLYTQFGQITPISFSKIITEVKHVSLIDIGREPTMTCIKFGTKSRAKSQP